MSLELSKKAQQIKEDEGLLKTLERLGVVADAGKLWQRIRNRRDEVFNDLLGYTPQMDIHISDATRAERGQAFVEDDHRPPRTIRTPGGPLPVPLPVGTADALKLIGIRTSVTRNADDKLVIHFEREEWSPGARAEFVVK